MCSSTPDSRATLASRANAEPIACGLPWVTTAACLTALGCCDGTVDALVDVIEEHGVGTVDQMDEELAVALRPGQPGVYDADRGLLTPREGGVDDVSKHAPVELGVADDAAAADLVLPDLELGLDEHDRVPAGSQQLHNRRQRNSHADEGDVGDEQVRAGNGSSVSSRAFVRSSTVTRASLRSFGCSWP